MLIRNYIGGVVFLQNKVFLVENEKKEWTFPKGLLNKDETAKETALKKVFEAVGITAEIVAPAGSTTYEFFSIERYQPARNDIDWFVMKTQSEDFEPSESQKLISAGFFDIEQAKQLITYTQDRNLLNFAYGRYLNDLSS